MYGVDYAARSIGGSRAIIEMNILYLSTHLNIGGISSYIFTLANGLKKNGHNVYAASSGGELVSKFIAAGIPHLDIPIKTKSEINILKIWGSFLKLKKFVTENNIDIIHANTRVTQVLAYFLSRNTKKPYISTCHGFFKKRFSRKIFPCWGRRVIAISEPVREHLKNDFKVKSEDMRVVHNGIDVQRFSQPYAQAPVEIKKRSGLKNGPVVGIIARLSDVKGHAYLIEAMSLVFKKIPDAQLLIAGEGRIKDELVNLTERLKISEHVFFIPNIYDTKEFLSVMDLFVLPSLKEGLGLSLMEAMASGLGVVGSDVGGIKSLIQDRINGLLVRPADAEGLARAILELLEDKEKRNKFGENAKNFIAQNFSQERMASETEGVYLECLSEKH